MRTYRHPGRIWVLVCAATLLCIVASPALEPAKDIHEYVHVVLRPQDGLPEKSVQAIAQTRDGYLWFGTQEGLARFDGHAFRVFKTPDTPELSSNFITSLAETRDGSLWIGTYGGGLVQYLNGRFRKFTENDGLSRNFVMSLREDKEGRLWILTTRGPSTYFQGKLAAVSDPLLHDFRVSAIAVDGAGIVWLTGSNGLMQYSQGRFSPVLLPKMPGTITSLVSDGTDVIWMGTANGHLGKLRQGVAQWFGPEQGLPTASLSALLLDRHQNLWVGTEGSGLCRFTDGHASCFTQKDGLSDDVIRPLFEDHEGNLWVGTVNGGADRFTDGRLATVGAWAKLSGVYIQGVLEGKDGTIWMGSPTGLSRIRHGAVEKVLIPGGAASNNIWSLWESRDGALWIGTKQAGVYRLQDGKFTHYAKEQGLASNEARSIAEDASGSMWFGATHSLTRLQNGKLRPYTKEDGISPEGLMDIIDDHQGGLWFATLKGLAHFDGKGFSSLSIPPLAGKEIGAIVAYLDSHNVLWVGTLEGGLMRWKDGKWARITTQNGLFSDSIWTLMEDDRGYMWMTSNIGIARVRKSELDEFADSRRAEIESEAFGVSDGMADAECNGGYSPGAWRTRDGRLLFAGAEGVVIAEPARIRPDAVDFPMVVEGVSVNGSALLQNGASVPVGDGALQFDFAALTYSNPDKVRFRYQLEGFDRAWKDAAGQHTAYYTNIPPGTYTFKVIAAKGSSGWSHTEAALTIELRPRFYQTRWFDALLAVIFCGLIVGAHRLRLRQLRKHKAELELLVQQRTSELADAKEAAEAATRSKSQFLANMSHEIRTPLNGVLGMLELANHTGVNDEDKEVLTMAQDSAHALLAVLNDILDFSKIEAGKLRFEEAEVDVVETVGEAARIMSVRAHQKGLELVYQIGRGVPAFIIGDAARLQQVLLNLLGNAVKFTEHGEVVLRVALEALREEEVELKFSISDTGIGISADQQVGIFEAFSQADSSVTRRFGGTGLGLAICVRIVQLMGGRIWVNSQPGQGSTFFFTGRFRIGTRTGRTSVPDYQSGLQGISALVVDDNSTSRSVLCQVLEFWGMRAEAAATAFEGLLQLEKALQSGRPFRLLISDYRMPEMDGLELIRKVKSNAKLAADALLMVTSNDYKQATVLCRGMGNVAHLLKPVKHSELRAAIHKLVQSPNWDTPEVALSVANGLPDALPPLRVLLAEDNLVNQKLAEKMLQKLGQQVVVVQNGKEALERIRQESFDLVLMDVHMPEMDGFAATHAVREWEKDRNTHIPIIAMTANAMKGDDQECFAAGMDGYIAKPVSLIVLQKTIAEQALGKSEARSQESGENQPQIVTR